MLVSLSAGSCCTILTFTRGVDLSTSWYLNPKFGYSQPAHRKLSVPPCSLTLAIQVALIEWTGRLEMSVFQTLSGGKIGLGIAPTGADAVTVMAAVPVFASQVAGR